MKILLVFAQPSIGAGKRMFNFGIALVSAVLKREGHETSLLNLDVFDANAIDKSLNSFNPDLICFSCSTDQIEIVKESASYIKNKEIPMIIAGTHATVFPEDSINVDVIMGICVGEGEEAIVEFVDALEKGRDYSKIKNFWFKKDGSILRNDLGPLIQDLDSIPFADRELFDYQDLLTNHKDGYEFMASRGCAYKCTFCIYPKLQDLYEGKGKFVRYRSVDNVLKEIKEVTGKYKTDFKFITFHDDIFTYDRSWLREFCEKYSEEFDIPFRCNVRVDRVDEEMFQLLKKANCDQIWMVVESGDEYIRNKIMKKYVKDEQIIRAFSLAKKYGIKSMAFTMIGLPYETEEQIKKTLELNKKLDTEIRGVNVFRPYPGTELYDISRDNGWISDREVTGYGDPSILDQPSISARKINYYRDILDPYVTGSKWLPLVRILARIRLRDESLYSFLRRTRYTLSTKARSISIAK